MISFEFSSMNVGKGSVVSHGKISFIDFPITPEFNCKKFLAVSFIMEILFFSSMTITPESKELSMASSFNSVVRLLYEIF